MTITGPNISTDNLLLYLDAANQNSFKGLPTFNYINEPLDPTTWTYFRDTNYGFVSDGYITYDGVLGRNIPAYTRTVFGSDYRGTRFDVPWTAHTSANLSEPLTSSIYVRCLQPSANTQIYLNFEGRNASDVRVDGGQFTNITTDDWVRVSATETLSDLNFVSLVTRMKFYLQSNDSVPRTWEVMMPQVEQMSEETPFVEGTRGTTSATNGGWLDLAGNNNNGELVGSIAYGEENVGGIAFNGSNTQITVPFNADAMDFSEAQTIAMWMEPGVGADSTRRNPYNQAYGGPGTLTHETSGHINYYFGTHGGNSQPYVGRSSGFTVEPEELVFISVTRDQAANLCRWYKNGQLITTGTAGGYAATANGSSPIILGAGYVSRFIGNIFSCMVYNRALSEEEIYNNFNATRGRFSL